MYKSATWLEMPYVYLGTFYTYRPAYDLSSSPIYQRCATEVGRVGIGAARLASADKDCRRMSFEILPHFCPINSLQHSSIYLSDVLHFLH